MGKALAISYELLSQVALLSDKADKNLYFELGRIGPGVLDFLRLEWPKLPLHPAKSIQSDRQVQIVVRSNSRRDIELTSVSSNAEPVRVHACFCRGRGPDEMWLAMNARGMLNFVAVAPPTPAEIRRLRRRFLRSLKCSPLFAKAQGEKRPYKFKEGGVKLRNFKPGKEAIDFNLTSYALHGLTSVPVTGLVAVFGETGSGKTEVVSRLMMFQLLEEIFCGLKQLETGGKVDFSRPHLITFEDPVEKSFLAAGDPASWLLDATHREKGVTCGTIADFYESALRQKPAITSFGELRDSSDWKIAVSFAGTGHRAFCTAHAANLTESLSKILASCGCRHGSDDAANVLAKLALVVHLKRLPCGSVVPAYWVGTRENRLALLARHLRALLPEITGDCRGYAGGCDKVIEIARQSKHIGSTDPSFDQIRNEALEGDLA